MWLRPVIALGLLICAVPAASAAAFDFAALRTLVAQLGAGGVEAVVAALPEDLRSQYTLVFASRSLQGADWRDPRAVLFGSSARLVITFNGDPSERGYGALETMEFSGNAFRFREVSFEPGQEGFVPRISEANPARCTACHGDPARPIWDAAPLWPGVYGERYGMSLSDREFEGLKQFLAHRPAHPRYRHLLGADALTERDTYVANSRTRYAGGTVEPPNSRLSALLATYNVQAILAQLATQPGFAAHLPLLVAATDPGCGELATFFPDSMASRLNDDRREFDAKARAADRRQALAKVPRQDGRGNVRAGLTESSDLTPLRFVVERQLGVSTERWTMAFERGSYDLSAPAGSVTLAAALRTWLFRSDPTLAEAAAYRSFATDDGYCARLRRASRESLVVWYASHTPPDPPPPRNGRPALISRCAACHTGDVGPRIPFADPAALAPLLLVGGHGRGRLLDEILYRLAPEAGAERMPRGINVTADERRELERYFIAVAAGGRPD